VIDEGFRKSRPNAKRILIAERPPTQGAGEHVLLRRLGILILLGTLIG
jgi:hypothetical protein